MALEKKRIKKMTKLQLIAETNPKITAFFTKRKSLNKLKHRCRWNVRSRRSSWSGKTFPTLAGVLLEKWRRVEAELKE